MPKYLYLSFALLLLSSACEVASDKDKDTDAGNNGNADSMVSMDASTDAESEADAMADAMVDEMMMEQKTPVDCVVSAWSEYGECSKECGGGKQTRTRTITTPAANGGAACPALSEEQDCNLTPCRCNTIMNDATCDGRGECVYDGTSACYRCEDATTGMECATEGGGGQCDWDGSSCTRGCMSYTNQNDCTGNSCTWLDNFCLPPL